MSTSSHRLVTRCAHAGSRRPAENPANASFQPPIVQSSIFDLGTSQDAEEIFSGARAGHAYTRFSNPTVATLAAAIADLEGGAGALVTSSGNAATLCAVTAALMRPSYAGRPGLGAVGGVGTFGSVVEVDRGESA